MAVQIIDRGRGPELAGTRVTVYRLMDYLRDGASPQQIADDLQLTEDQVLAGLAYIEQHRAQVEDEYDAILQRLARQHRAAPVSAVTPDELKRRIRERATPHAGPSRQ